MLTLGERSGYVRHHAAEALNFQITVLIVTVVSFVLTLVFVGILLMAVVGIVGLVLAIIAAVRAYQGDRYQYPLILRLVK